MSQFTDCAFDGSTVVLDGNEYLRCRFRHSRIVVTRGNFSLRESSFDTCTFEFGGEAENIKTLVLSLLDQTPAQAKSPTVGAQ